jgi:hypothetical protein
MKTQKQLKNEFIGFTALALIIEVDIALSVIYYAHHNPFIYYYFLYHKNVVSMLCNFLIISAVIYTTIKVTNKMAYFMFKFEKIIFKKYKSIQKSFNKNIIHAHLRG